ncbi:hypothetical protein KUL97_01340 [Synechococcus sp. HK05]|uniref:hypothetical protein n=1 Tax=Synechococcus sp. HK05 TaxID=2725975 RepID=UPI001C38CC79|nr:hypothetical protein [Synechococcus sp. HK05]MBV2350346.1 hypothetical protein [Synechococcus sp. HK05]
MLLWLYFWIVLFEGVLRKWFFPGLSTPLLVARDPLALLALWWGWPLLQGPRWSLWVNSLFVIGSSAFVFALLFGHGDLFVAFFGARILVLQFPLIFLFASVFNRTDVIAFAWFLALAAIPMTILISIQSGLPPTHFLNQGPGGDGTSAFLSGALDRFRPSGAFTFVAQLAAFYPIAAASFFSLTYGTKRQRFSIPLLFLISVSLLVAAPVSISRLLVFGYAQVVLAVLIALIASRSSPVTFLYGFAALFLGFVVATSVPAFRETQDAFAARWDMAIAADGRVNGVEQGVSGTLQNRVLSQFIEPFSDSYPLIGAGIGAGTNVGAVRLTGDFQFLLSENAWGASVAEMGLVLGVAFILWRFIFSLYLAWLALISAYCQNTVPLIMTGSCLLPLMIGQTFQPTSLGLIVVSCGLALAATNNSEMMSILLSGSSPPSLPALRQQ